MKKLMGLFLSGVAVIVLSGCGSSSSSGSDNGDDSGSGGNSYFDVHILDLEQGYAISGYNSDSEDVTLMYCNDQYDYYRGNEYFYGIFNIVGSEVQMSDSAGGSYIIGTPNDLLEVDENYYIWDVGSDITVESISLINC